MATLRDYSQQPIFWAEKQATPVKMAINSKILDAKTGDAASTGQLIGRYLAYYLSFIVLGLGFIWVAFDARNQGWHDKLSGTVVVCKKKKTSKPVEFDR